MKILVFSGGLGNQIFGYAFYKYIKSKFKNERFYGNYGTKTKEHYGLEIDKWFNVSLPPEKWWINILLGILYFYKQFIPKSELFDLNRLEWKNKKALVFFSFKFNKKYIPKSEEWLTWKVDDKDLNLKNRLVLNYIRNNQTCFIHVRRGDYLSPRFKELFEGCCTKEYYINAIKYMVDKYPNVKFVVFSDDIPWVKNNLPIGEDTQYISWNTGVNSPLDMFLMSQCNHGIIANSTFSYWGACLGIKKITVCYPIRWWNSKLGTPDIFMDDWIGL